MQFYPWKLYSLPTLPLITLSLTILYCNYVAYNSKQLCPPLTLSLTTLSPVNSIAMHLSHPQFFQSTMHTGELTQAGPGCKQGSLYPYSGHPVCGHSPLNYHILNTHAITAILSILLLRYYAHMNCAPENNKTLFFCTVL